MAHEAAPSGSHHRHGVVRARIEAGEPGCAQAIVAGLETVFAIDVTP